MVEVVWECEICMDTSMQGSFRDPEVQILTLNDQSVNANIELIDTVRVLNTPPALFSNSQRVTVLYLAPLPRSR